MCLSSERWTNFFFLAHSFAHHQQWPQKQQQLLLTSRHRTKSHLSEWVRVPVSESSALFLGKFNYQRQRQTLTETVCVHRYTRKRRRQKKQRFHNNNSFFSDLSLDWNSREGKGAKVVFFSSHFALCSWRICMSRVHQQFSQVLFEVVSHWIQPLNQKEEREREKERQSIRSKRTKFVSAFFFLSSFFLNKSNRSSEALKCLVVINPLSCSLT